jgi:hypothetical protein
LSPGHQTGTTTLSTITFRMMTLSITIKMHTGHKLSSVSQILSVIILSFCGAMTLSKMAYSLMTLSKHDDTQHNNENITHSITIKNKSLSIK